MIFFPWKSGLGISVFGYTGLSYCTKSTLCSVQLLVVFIKYLRHTHINYTSTVSKVSGVGREPHQAHSAWGEGEGGRGGAGGSGGGWQGHHLSIVAPCHQIVPSCYQMWVCLMIHLPAAGALDRRSPEKRLHQKSFQLTRPPLPRNLDSSAICKVHKKAEHWSKSINKLKMKKIASLRRMKHDRKHSQ